MSRATHNHPTLEPRSLTNKHDSQLGIFPFLRNLHNSNHTAACCRGKMMSAVALRNASSPCCTSSSEMPCFASRPVGVRNFCPLSLGFACLACSHPFLCLVLCPSSCCSLACIPSTLSGFALSPTLTCLSVLCLVACLVPAPVFCPLSVHLVGLSLVLSSGVGVTSVFFVTSPLSLVLFVSLSSVFLFFALSGF